MEQREIWGHRPWRVMHFSCKPGNAPAARTSKDKGWILSGAPGDAWVCGLDCGSATVTLHFLTPELEGIHFCWLSQQVCGDLLRSHRNWGYREYQTVLGDYWIQSKAGVFWDNICFGKPKNTSSPSSYIFSPSSHFLFACLSLLAIAEV